MSLLSQKELLSLLFLSFTLELCRDSLFDQFKQNRAHLDHLLMDDVQTLHLHVSVSLICLLVPQLVYILFRCSRVQQIDQRDFQICIFILRWAGLPTAWTHHSFRLELLLVRIDQDSVNFHGTSRT